MKNNIRGIIIGVVMIIGIVFLYLFTNNYLLYYSPKPLNEMKLVFRPLYGTINTYRSGEFSIAAPFIVSDITSEGLQKFSGDITNSIAIDDNIIVRSAVSTEVFRNKNNSYFQLNLKLRLKEGTDKALVFSTIKFFEKEYQIGNLQIGKKEENDGDLSIKSIRALSKGLGLYPFNTVLENNNDKQPVIIKEIIIPNMENIQNEAFVTFSQSQNPMRVSASQSIPQNSIVDLNIKFINAYKPDDISIYYISPILTYVDSKGEHKIYFDNYTCGVLIDMNDFIKLLSK